MESFQRSALYTGAVSRYANAPPEKPRVRFPWGAVAGLVVLIIAYLLIKKYTFS